MGKHLLIIFIYLGPLLLLFFFFFLSFKSVSVSLVFCLFCRICWTQNQQRHKIVIQVLFGEAKKTTDQSFFIKQNYFCHA